MLVPALQDATVLTLTALVCTCIASMLASTLTSILAYMKSRDNATALAAVAIKGDENGEKIDVVHTMSNDRLTKCYEEIKELREQLNKLLGTSAGMQAARVQADMGLKGHGLGSDPLHADPPPRPDPPRSGPR